MFSTMVRNTIKTCEFSAKVEPELAISNDNVKGEYERGIKYFGTYKHTERRKYG